MKLIIAEKYSVAQAIGTVVKAYIKKDGYMEGNNYIVSWCMGHLAGLAEPHEYREDWKEWKSEALPMIPCEWQLIASKDEDKIKQYKVLKSLMNSSEIESIICATDADREGECIFRYVYRLSDCHKPVQRLWISSLEAAAIKDGFAKLQSDSAYDSLFYAGFCRAKADWLVGINFTRLFSVKYNADKPLSIGRVQTPTLDMIVERERKIKSFVQVKSYTADLKLATEKGIVTAVSETVFASSAEAADLAEKCKGKRATVSDIKTEAKTSNAPKLYDLTTLQRDCNKFFGYTAQHTLDTVQSLYEQRLCTYPRTDSRYLPDDMKANVGFVLSVIPCSFGFGSDCNMQNISAIFNTAKAKDHPALIPQKRIAEINIDTLPENERKVLMLMAGRMLCAVGRPEKYQTEKAEISVEGVGERFFASGKTIIEAGWTRTEQQINSLISPQDNKNDKKEEIISVKGLLESFDNIGAEVSEHLTSPPRHFTEDTLLSAMEHAGQEFYDENAEKKGIGTPATRAAIIESLVKRYYIKRDKKQLLPTEKGFALIDAVPDSIKSPKLTADWEKKLQEIEKNNYDSEEFMEEISKFVQDICKEQTESKGENTAAFSAPASGISGKCPRCGQEVKRGKYGFYCSGKCGMQLSKVFGKELTENQLSNLLIGKKVTFTHKGRKTVVLPEAAAYSFIGRDGKEHSGFQWRTE